MKSPKKAFQEDPARVLAASEALARPEVQAALQAAYAELAFTQQTTTNPALAGMYHYHLEGARQFLSTLENLPTNYKPPTKPNTTLEYDNPGTPPPLPPAEKP